MRHPTSRAFLTHEVQGIFRFRFKDVSPGLHWIEFDAPKLQFPSLRVDVPASPAAPVELRYLDLPLPPLDPPFHVAPGLVREAVEFAPRMSISPSALMRNPMVLIGVMALFAVFVMPYISPNPDEIKALQEEMGWLKKDGAGSAVAATGSAATGGRGGGGRGGGGGSTATSARRGRAR
ncbi:unnamed protein product [Pedinophyceae sp. YPF-701]|nr:unnamed protein product [Pedinophyceae sp. YPF-701]